MDDSGLRKVLHLPFYIYDTVVKKYKKCYILSMKRHIDDKDLENLLLKEQKHIGSGPKDIGCILSGGLFIFTNFASQYKDYSWISGDTIWWIALLLGIGITFYGIINLLIGLKRYTYMDLKKKIMKLDQVESRHSLVAMRDYFNKSPQKFLVYYDKNWKCWLLPNFKTQETKDNTAVKSGMAHIFGVDGRGVRCKMIGEATHVKMSQRTKKRKTYQHLLYDVAIKKLPEDAKASEFDIAGTKYKWMTIPEMESDPRIMECNSDVVSFIKETVR